MGNVESGSSEQIAIRFDGRGATVYMTREALKELARDLERLISADPKECFEIHLGWHFSEFDAQDRHKMPSVTLGGKLWPLFDKMLEADFNAGLADGSIEPDGYRSPLEVTIMHVSKEAVAEVASGKEGDSED